MRPLWMTLTTLPAPPPSSQPPGAPEPAARLCYHLGTMELLLIRHGLPLRVENSDGSPADPPLAPEGRDQAERLARLLAAEPLDAVIASPLRRARETAEPLLERVGGRLEIVPGVAEFDARSASYVPLDEIKRAHPERWRELVAGELFVGVDVEGFRRTVIRSLEELADRHRGAGRVAVFCHGGVINVYAAHVLGLDRPFFFEPGYTSVSRFRVAGSGEGSLLSLNEMGHLRADGPGAPRAGFRSASAAVAGDGSRCGREQEKTEPRRREKRDREPDDDHPGT